MRHRRIGYHLLRGKGLEVGALHHPASLPEYCSVVYCDVQTPEAAARVFSELKPESLIPVDVVADLDKDGLRAWADGSLDFVVLNHVIEHLANPIHALEEIFRVLKPGGLAVLSVHDKIYSLDKKRPSPTFEHVVEEYRAGVTEVSEDHYDAFLRAVHPRVFNFGDDEVEQAMRTVRLRREQAHAWDSNGFREFLDLSMALLGVAAVKRFESLGQDNKLEYFSVWQKYSSQDDLATIVADSNRQYQRVGESLVEREAEIAALSEQLAARDAHLVQVLATRSWRYSAPLRRVERLLHKVNMVRAAAGRYLGEHGGLFSGAWRLAAAGLAGAIDYGPRHVLREAKNYIVHGDKTLADVPRGDVWALEPVSVEHKILAHRASVDIIVCVHNALEDVQRCLSSVIRHTLPPYNLILVDDGSAEPTCEYLSLFAAEQDALLIRNEQARGYTLAANQGLHAASGDYVVLLNSDTIVTPDWLDRMAMCAESDRAIGIVGPLSNTASWQSVPLLEENGDWADNALPEGVSVDDMATLVACRSSRLYPRIPFLNGFCLMIKRALIDDIGYFDEVAFARGYGEENDYSLRAAKAGWQLAVADDVYVFHAQSKSYSHERRKALCDLAGAALAEKHGHEIIEQGVRACRQDDVLQGIRARAARIFERRDLIERGLAAWEGRRVLFVMPVMAAGGGANVVISEARAMIGMGVDARILNLLRIRAPFEDSYPELDVPVIYAEDETDFADIAAGFDAVIATANHTVQWLKPLVDRPQGPVIGYYIQDFEPYFYSQNSAEYRVALDSYTAIADLRCFTKTEWNRAEVQDKTGVDCALIGPSFEADTFMPRRSRLPAWPKAPLRICAMVRPSSERREPALTMRVLRMIQHAFPRQVEIVIFGVAQDDPKFLALPRDFAFINRGEQTPWQMAALLNEMDIFADFSTYQAMGLTAMEAMSCGLAVIVPRAGGASSFARDEENALMVDTASERECYKSLERLVLDNELRIRLQNQALIDVAGFGPDRAATAILQVLFGGGQDI